MDGVGGLDGKGGKEGVPSAQGLVPPEVWEMNKLVVSTSQRAAA